MTLEMLRQNERISVIEFLRRDDDYRRLAFDYEYFMSIGYSSNEAFKRILINFFKGYYSYGEREFLLDLLDIHSSLISNIPELVELKKLLYNERITVECKKLPVDNYYVRLRQKYN